MAEFGRLDAFLSEDQLLRFRAITNLLRTTTKLDNVSKRGLGIIKTNLGRSEELTLYSHLRDFGHLLVRHLEVVAVTTPDPKSKLVRICQGNENRRIMMSIEAMGV
jgi:hypothetical protein